MKRILRYLAIAAAFSNLIQGIYHGTIQQDFAQGTYFLVLAILCIFGIVGFSE